MSEYYLIYILAFLIIIAFIFVSFQKKATPHKSAVIKKDELIKSYEDSMLELINKYKNNKDELKIKKILYLKQASKELHNNIFFDAPEATKIIQKLASL